MRSLFSVVKLTLVLLNIWVLAVVLVVTLGNWRGFEPYGLQVGPKSSHVIFIRELKEENDGKIGSTPTITVIQDKNPDNSLIQDSVNELQISDMKEPEEIFLLPKNGERPALRNTILKKTTVVTKSTKTMAIIPANSNQKMAIMPANSNKKMAIVPANSNQRMAIMPAVSNKNMAIVPANSNKKMAIMPANSNKKMAIVPANSNQKMANMPAKPNQNVAFVPAKSDKKFRTEKLANTKTHVAPGQQIKIVSAKSNKKLAAGSAKSGIKMPVILEKLAYSKKNGSPGGKLTKTNH